jgi:hypothetical protein
MVIYEKPGARSAVIFVLFEAGGTNIVRKDIIFGGRQRRT